jgi:hypothetical protein
MREKMYVTQKRAGGVVYHLWGTLDFLEFPWILSSETRLINELHRISIENFSRAFSPHSLDPETRWPIF